MRALFIDGPQFSRLEEISTDTIRFPIHYPQRIGEPENIHDELRPDAHIRIITYYHIGYYYVPGQPGYLAIAIFSINSQPVSELSQERTQQLNELVETILVESGCGLVNSQSEYNDYCPDAGLPRTPFLNQLSQTPPGFYSDSYSWRAENEDSDVMSLEELLEEIDKELNDE